MAVTQTLHAPVRRPATRLGLIILLTVVTWVGVVFVWLGTGWLWTQIELHYALQPRADTPLPATVTIAMLGDSQTQIANWPMLLDCPNVANFGVAGQTSAQILARVDQVIAAKPKAAFIMAGTNDGATPPSVTIRNLADTKAALMRAGIYAIVINPPPLRDHAVADIPADIRIDFDRDDLLKDGVHLRRSGYQKWRDGIAPVADTFCR
jgi:hypothetical protein